MKRMVMSILSCVLFISFFSQIYSQEIEKGGKEEVCIEDLKKERDILKKKEIPEFEKKIIESDDELKNLREKIKEIEIQKKNLEKELSDKLKTKLSSNEEYQKLQKRLKDIEAKIKELEKEGKK